MSERIDLWSVFFRMHSFRIYGDNIAQTSPPETLQFVIVSGFTWTSTVFHRAWVLTVRTWPRSTRLFPSILHAHSDTFTLNSLNLSEAETHQCRLPGHWQRVHSASQEGQHGLFIYSAESFYLHAYTSIRTQFISVASYLFDSRFGYTIFFVTKMRSLFVGIRSTDSCGVGGLPSGASPGGG
jgi:hypothetical protein